MRSLTFLAMAILVLAAFGGGYYGGISIRGPSTTSTVAVISGTTYSTTMMVTSTITFTVAQTTTQTLATTKTMTETRPTTDTKTETTVSTETTTETVVAGSGKFASLTIAILHEDVGNLGPDGKTHETFVPSNLTIYAGQMVNLTIYNYDGEAHSLTIPTLNRDIEIPAYNGVGLPSVVHAQLSVQDPGVYRWWCHVPCDLERGGWAMKRGSDGLIGQIGFMGVFVIVLAP